MSCEGVWFHGCKCLVAVALHGCSNEKGVENLRLSLLYLILVSGFVRSQQGPPYL